MDSFVDGALYGVLIGGLVGIAPVIVGALKHKLGLGIGGFFVCILSGVMLGLLLAVPVCGIFIYLIVKNDNSPSSLKKCPFCAEKIAFEAKVCKHCGRDLPLSNEMSS